MHLREELLRGIYGYGFEKPSAIQQRAIAPCIKGHDVIAQAQSGTGKTATFSISILQKIDINARDCQALILHPIHAYFEILDDGADDELEDAESDGFSLRFAPQKSFGLDLTDFRLHRTQIRLVIPRLHVQNHVRLGDQSRLLRLLFGVRRESFLFLRLGRFIDFVVVVGTEHVKIIVIFLFFYHLLGRTRWRRGGGGAR